MYSREDPKPVWFGDLGIIWVLYISRNKLFSFIYLIKWYTWIISWGKYISMTFMKAKGCLAFNFMSIMKPSDHIRFWEAFVFHSTIDLKSYKRKNSVAIVTISVNYQTYMITIKLNIIFRFSIYSLLLLSNTDCFFI